MINRVRKWFTESAGTATKKEVSEQEQLKETEIRSDNTLPVKIISPGWGSSGYYSEDVLRNYAGMYREGTQMYWDHPASSEEWERPERSLRDFAGVLASDGRYEENGASGPGIYADAKLFTPFNEYVQEISEHIGLSHRAQGEVSHGEADGREGMVVETIDKVVSVDFVTLPGRGGEVVQFLESRKPDTSIQHKKEDDDLKWSEITLEGLKENRPQLYESMQEGDKKLNETIDEKNKVIDQLTEKNKELIETKARAQVDKLIEKVAGEAQLPQVATERIKNSYNANLPISEGQLDVEKAESAIKGLVESEQKYIQSLGANHKINMGESAQEQNEPTEDDLVESFKAMGLDESAAKNAAKGRN